MGTLKAIKCDKYEVFQISFDLASEMGSTEKCKLLAMQSRAQDHKTEFGDQTQISSI
jgi:hypothetical protein